MTPDGQVDWPSTRGLYFRDTSDRSTAGASDLSLEVSNGECHDCFALSCSVSPRPSRARRQRRTPVRLRPYRGHHAW